MQKYCRFFFLKNVCNIKIKGYKDSQNDNILKKLKRKDMYFQLYHLIKVTLTFKISA